MSNHCKLVSGVTIITATAIACSAAGRMTAELPRGVQVGAITCQASSAVIVGWQHRESISPASGVRDTEAVAFRVSADGGVRRVPLGAGMATSVSSPDNRVVYTVRRRWLPDRPEEGALFRSSDFGMTWQPIATAPPNITGVAFESSDSGYVWSDTQIFHTSDRGATWNSVRVPGALPKANPAPVVDQSGALWIATGHEPPVDRQHNVIARIHPDLQVDSEVVGTDFAVWAMDVSDDGALWLLTTDEPARVLTHVRKLWPGRGSDGLTQIAELPSGLPLALRVFGRSVVAVIAKAWSTTPNAFEMVSRDGGATWTRRDPREPRLDAMCFVTAESSWIVGPAGKVYAPAR